MFENVNVPILGVIENMAGFTCSHCNEVTPIFGKGGGEKFARERNVPFLGSVPIDARVVATGDEGKPAVMAFPDSLVSKCFVQIAKDMAARLSVRQAEASGTFKPLSMDWQ
jgi:ATP-binding protein involved in chromosome partitioning